MAPETPVSPWKRARPDVGADAAARILREHWGIEGELRELGSNQDRNYLVTEADGRRRVLKIDNAATTRAEVEAQHFAVEALLAAGVVVPRPSEALAGGGIVEVDGHLARLQEFIDGGTLAMRPEFGETEARALGEVAGQVVAALADVEHPGFDRTTQWDLRNAGDVVADLLDGIGDDARRRRVKSETKSALRAIAAVADELPVQPVHGDLTDDNAVRTGAASLGVIDLGDLGLGWRVAELAVAIASVLQRTGSLALAAACVDEFGRHAKLADAELAALWPLVRLRGRSPSGVEEGVRALLAQVQLGPEYAGRLPSELSGGEQQRVAIARALAHDPLLLLADEPTGNLDEETGEKVLELLLQLTRSAGKSLIMATHSAEVVPYADVVYEIHEGRLVAEQRREPGPDGEKLPEPIL